MIFCFTSYVSSTRTFNRNIIRAKLDVNPIFASGGQGKNRGSQSETLACYIKITYLNKELWNIFQWRSPFWGLEWEQLCQHVWASRNISVHFQIKYVASFLSLYQIHILKTRKNDVFDEGKRYVCFQNIAITTQETRTEEIWPILSAVLQLGYIRSIKPNNIRTDVDWGLRTVDNDSSPHPCEKTLLPYSHS